MDLPNAQKLFSRNFFLEQAACLHDQIDCFTCNILLYKYFVVKYKFRSSTGPLSLSLSSSAIVAANGEITKVVDSEKEKTMKNCSLA